MRRSISKVNGHRANRLQSVGHPPKVPPFCEDALTSSYYECCPRSTVMPTGHSANESNRTCIITLVHGTRPYGLFPWWHALFRAPPWFTKGSVFRSNLESELRRENIAATFRIFQWTGNNSVFHRARAADELSGLLAFDSANANSIVIAHSHGGNVALRAISKLGSRGASIHLVTLATPFFRAFPTWGGPSFMQLLIYFAFAILFGAYLLHFYFKSVSARSATYGLEHTD